MAIAQHPDGESGRLQADVPVMGEIAPARSDPDAAPLSTVGGEDSADATNLEHAPISDATIETPASTPATSWYHVPEGYRETLRLGVPFAGRGVAVGVLILVLVLLASNGGMTVAVGLGFFQPEGITSVPPAEVPHRFAGHLGGLAPGKGVAVASLRAAEGSAGGGRQQTWYRYRLRAADVENYRHDVRAHWLATPGHTARGSAGAPESQDVPEWWDLATAASTKDVRPLTLALPDGSPAYHFAFASDGFVYVVVCR